MYGIEDPVTGDFEVFFLTDEKTGERIYDSVCKVACGACCGYWTKVRELQHLVGRNLTKKKCPMLRENGCRLKRKKMPDICKSYLCELGMLVKVGLATLEEAKQCVELGMQNHAARELRKKFPVQRRETIDAKKILSDLGWR